MASANNSVPSLMDVLRGILRERREEQGISQDELAYRSGYDRTYISLLERGRRSPSITALFNLCEELELPPSRLMREIELRVGFKESMKRVKDRRIRR